MKSFALSGVDGVGKSQQIQLLKSHGAEQFHFTRPLIFYDSRWPRFNGADMARWWFEQVDPESFIDIVLSSLVRRSNDFEAGKIAVHDRGTRMFKAVLAATLLTRGFGSEDEIIKLVEDAFLKRLNYELLNDVVEHDIALIPSVEYQSKIDKYIHYANPLTEQFTEEGEKRYDQYQTYLRKMVERFVYPFSDAVIVDRSIIEVQNEIRALMVGLLSVDLPPYLDGKVKVVALGGLSECGKSSFAERLKTEGFHRLKQKYFFEIAELVHGNCTPSAIIQEILRFFQAHTIAKQFSLESLHDPAVPSMLKLLLGDMVSIVYIETSLKTRTERCALELNCSMDLAREQVLQKDSLKLQRGANLVKDIADLIICNDGDDFISNFQALANIIQPD